MNGSMKVLAGILGTALVAVLVVAVQTYISSMDLNLNYIRIKIDTIDERLRKIESTMEKLTSQQESLTNRLNRREALPLP